MHWKVEYDYFIFSLKNFVYLQWGKKWNIYFHLHNQLVHQPLNTEKGGILLRCCILCWHWIAIRSQNTPSVLEVHLSIWHHYQEDTNMMTGAGIRIKTTCPCHSRTPLCLLSTHQGDPHSVRKLLTLNTSRLKPFTRRAVFFFLPYNVNICSSCGREEGKQEEEDESVICHIEPWEVPQPCR